MGCTCDPLRPTGCKSKECINHNTYAWRRAGIATRVLELCLVEAQERCVIANVTDPDVRCAEAAKEAVRAADALIEALYK